MIRHKDYLLVQVPEDAKDFSIHSLDDYDKLVFSSAIQDPLNCGGDMLILPPGSWQLICLAAELTEEQWRDMDETLRLKLHTIDPKTTVILKLIQP